jgi:hypothetical protein
MINAEVGIRDLYSSEDLIQYQGVHFFFVSSQIMVEGILCYNSQACFESYDYICYRLLSSRICNL